MTRIPARILLFLLLSAAAGCRTEEPAGRGEPPVDGGVPGEDTAWSPPDADADGFTADVDCDDEDALAHPGALEICDGVDDDCDGVVDEPTEQGAETWHRDADGDGFGDPRVLVFACTAPPGFVADDADCDDDDGSSWPGAPELDCADPVDHNCDGVVAFRDVDGDGHAACEDCDDHDAAVSPDAVETCDGIDDDCDGAIDEDDAADAVASYADRDGDGFGDASDVLVGCDVPAGRVLDASDCDDTDAATFPGAPETCTDPTDRDCDGSSAFADGDGDGWAACADCDDTDAAANPDAAEICDGRDDDCDGAIDEGVTTAVFADVDGDGFGDPATAVDACSPADGWVLDGTDCDDADAATHPGATEACTDPHDRNCDGSVTYADADADGWAACVECDDANAAVNPGASETCDGIDDDCDGAIDEGVTTPWYADADADGYGDPDSAVDACSPPDGWIADGTDCDDADAATYPGAPEACTDPTDRDCDGSTSYADTDGDGWAACEDCDDADPAVNPDAVEVCNGIDDNCDESVDEGVTTTFFADTDGDGFGDPGAPVDACEAPAGTVSDATDCDDADAAVNPLATEVVNGIDDDCDGVVE